MGINFKVLTRRMFYALEPLGDPWAPRGLSGPLGDFAKNCLFGLLTRFQES